MEDATTLIDQVERIGIPAAILVACLFGLYVCGKWITGNLNSKLDAQQAILISLIDRVRSMDHELIRLAVTLKLLLNLDPSDELPRIGKCPKDEQRKD